MCSANVMAITLCNIIWPKGVAKGKVKMDRDPLGSVKVFSNFLSAH